MNCISAAFAYLILCELVIVFDHTGLGTVSRRSWLWNSLMLLIFIVLVGVIAVLAGHAI